MGAIIALFGLIVLDVYLSKCLKSEDAKLDSFSGEFEGETCECECDEFDGMDEGCCED